MLQMLARCNLVPGELLFIDFLMTSLEPAASSCTSIKILSVMFYGEIIYF